MFARTPSPLPRVAERLLSISPRRSRGCRPPPLPSLLTCSQRFSQIHALDMSLFENSRLLWKHPRPIRTRVEALRQMINHRHGLNLSAYDRSESLNYYNYNSYHSKEDYDELHAYSITNDTFWVDLWTFLGIVSSVAPDPSKVSLNLTFTSRH